MGGRTPLAVIGLAILGTQMLALMPLARERDVPLLTISGTARLERDGRAAVLPLLLSERHHGEGGPCALCGRRSSAPSGRPHLPEHRLRPVGSRACFARTFAALKIAPAFEESVAPTVNDLGHRQAAAGKGGQRRRHRAPSPCRLDRGPGGAAGAPAAARRADRRRLGDAPTGNGALLEPAGLSSACAETAASPVSGTSQPMRDFVAAYRAAFKSDPDAFAAAQFDAVHMLGHVIGGLLHEGTSVTPMKVRERLGTARAGRAWSRPIGPTARATWHTKPRSSASTAPIASRAWRRNTHSPSPRIKTP